MTPRIFITGASSGLGEALALEHAWAGDRVCIFARRADRLRAVAQACLRRGAPAVLIAVGDVSRRADLDRALTRVDRAWGGLDVAYANAGYAQGGRVEALTLEQWRSQMGVNVEGVFHTAQACLPRLRASRGRLALIGSVAGYGSLAETGAYSASKAAVRALAQVLDLEVGPSGVSVTHVAPGFFASEIRLKATNGAVEKGLPEYIPRLILGDPAAIARTIRRAVERRHRELVLPRHAEIAVFFLRHFPGLSRALIQRFSGFRLRRRRRVQGA